VEIRGGEQFERRRGTAEIPGPGEFRIDYSLVLIVNTFSVRFRAEGDEPVIGDHDAVARRFGAHAHDVEVVWTAFGQ